MLLAHITFIIACGIVSGIPTLDYTAAERTRALGLSVDANSRLVAPCPGAGPSPSIPTSVHALRPGDIKYIGAIGDSLTAASGGNAGSIFGMLTQYRGVSWICGGAEDLTTTVTLPNILRQYNPDLYGHSIGNGDQNSSNARYNAARPGAISIEMAGQADLLVNRMINDLGAAEFNSAWKLVNFFIGGNDLCDYCTYPDYHSAEAYVANVKAALDIFKARMPRTLVNFVTVLNVAELEDLHDGLVCQNMQLFLCDCAINQDSRELVRAATLLYQAGTNALIGSGIYDVDDDFTVVVQSFMEHMTVPATPDGYPDFSYFAPDCFHFSKKGHGAAAIELWNNMMQPVGSKTTIWHLDDTLKCPTSGDGYIYTWKNSGL